MKMLGRIVSAVIVVLLLASVSGSGVSAQGEGETFTLSIGVSDCDADPRDNPDAICAPSEGIRITVTLESGTLIGSCTLDLFYTPYGGVASSCGVEGVPLNSTLIIEVDPDSLPIGYRPLNSPQTFEVGDIIPGGGDSPVISIITVWQQSIGGEPPLIYRWAVIHHGICNDIKDEVVRLYPVVIAKGPRVGLADAIEAETSYRTVDKSLDVLIDEPHVVVVHERLDSRSPVIACGEIGGRNDGDGELIIGLHEMNGSGFFGVVRLSYNADDPEQTDVAVYLVNGLREGE
jgi:hypothetical protein